MLVPAAKLLVFQFCMMAFSQSGKYSHNSNEGKCFLNYAFSVYLLVVLSDGQKLEHLRLFCF